MINRNQKYMFTLTFDFINLQKIVQVFLNHFTTDPNIPVQDQIETITSEIMNKWSHWYHDLIRRPYFREVDNLLELSNKAFKTDYCEILKNDDFTLGIAINNNYENISLDQCVTPSKCYTLGLQTTSKSVLYDILDTLFYDGDELNYRIRVTVIDTLPEEKSNE